MALVEVSQLAMLLMISAQLETTLAASNFTLPPSLCSKSCGNISIHYPFGIGDGCFRAGFNLTCTSYNHTSPRLFLGDGTVEVSEINMDKGVVYIKSPIVTMSANSTSVSAQLIDLRRWPFSFNLGALYGSYFQSLVGNSWYAVGCSAIAVLVDSNTNKTVDNCLTVCSTTQPFATDSCVLDPYGKIGDKLSLGIELTRLSEDELHLVNTSDVKVIMYDRSINADDAEEPQQDSTMKRKITGSEVNAALAWYVNEYESCKEAKNKTTYACLSENSECLDAVADSDTMNTIGYMCRCSLSYSGNPYLPHGCQDSSSLTVNPASDCTTAKCGSIDIPYPFGLSEGCYRDQSFSLECDDATDPPALVYRNFYVVTNILLGEGKLELKITDHFPFYLVISDIKTVAFIEQRTIYSWVVAYQPCKDAKKNTSTFACVDQHSLCVDDNISSNGREILGYRCECSEGYEGNPYLHNGCKDINECKSKDKYKCYGICINTKGNYNCICPPGSYSPDPKIQNCTTDGHDKKQSLLLGISVGVSSGIGLLLLCAAFIILRRKWEKRKQKIMRKTYFRQNHGLLLKQLLSAGGDTIERTKIFSLGEIEKATNNFDKTRVLGRGGHGTVYKGILSDQRVVAIKKSKIAKKFETEQFINEVAVLSQINHRHVVKLYGCCLETEVPLLIYEFISNGTLSDHLHLPDGKSVLSWDDRLRIATETAGALTYLHSAASISIFHRDIKSSNILLDDHFTAKVSDFGTSRFIPHDQTHLVTLVQGTFGYLDPEYYYTGQLTEKSDVYSFGVILLELLTGKKPIYSTEDEGPSNLSMHFFQALRENQFVDLVEDHVRKEGTKEEILEIIELAEKCLNLKGADRPTMKEVDVTLQGLMRRITKRKREGKEDIEFSMLRDSGYAFTQSVEQANEGTSRNYSIENDFMSSYLPR